MAVEGLPRFQEPVEARAEAGDVLELSGVSKSYRQGGQHTVALAGVSLSVEPAELVAVVGRFWWWPS